MRDCGPQIQYHRNQTLRILAEVEDFFRSYRLTKRQRINLEALWRYAKLPYGLSQRKIAERVGRSRPWVKQHLYLEVSARDLTKPPKKRCLPWGPPREIWYEFGAKVVGCDEWVSAKAVQAWMASQGYNYSISTIYRWRNCYE